jgi:curved DNA-binding protein CbpA
MEDYYEVLGVSPLAGEREIARAYRQRTVQRHRVGVLSLEHRLRLMREAFETLSDPARRARYDRRRDVLEEPLCRDENERIRREGRVLRGVAHELATQSSERGAREVARYATAMRELGEEHARWEAEATAHRRRRVWWAQATALVKLYAKAWLLRGRGPW